MMHVKQLKQQFLSTHTRNAFQVTFSLLLNQKVYVFVN